jgi:hypothetical protein
MMGITAEPEMLGAGPAGGGEVGYRDGLRIGGFRQPSRMFGTNSAESDNTDAQTLQITLRGISIGVVGGPSTACRNPHRGRIYLVQ